MTALWTDLFLGVNIYMQTPSAGLLIDTVAPPALLESSNILNIMSKKQRLLFHTNKDYHIDWIVEPWSLNIEETLKENFKNAV